MKSKRQEHEGHGIELREREGVTELLIDGEPLGYGQLPDGSYFLDEYAYDPSPDLMELARRFIDYRLRADAVRRERAGGGEEK